MRIITAKSSLIFIELILVGLIITCAYAQAEVGGEKTMNDKEIKILLLTDGSGGNTGTDLDILYPEKVKRMNFTKEAHGLDVLSQYTCVITMVGSGTNVDKLDYGAVTAYAEAGGKVISCLMEYGKNRGLQYSKTHVLDRFRPAMIIEVENDITRGFAVGDTVWWYGTVSSAPDTLYDNQMYQRQLIGVLESENVSILATSNVNNAAIMIEEKVGKGRILALDLLSPNRPYYNSYGSTNKYVFPGNFISGVVRYGKQYPKKLSYEGFVAAMKELADRYPALSIQNEGPCSDGRDMWTFSIGDESKPTIYIGAAIHGWEWENAYGLLRFAELVCENPNLEGLDMSKLHFKILPIQNPWGYEHFTRQNGRGVDLNRNFDCGWAEFGAVQDVMMPWDYNYKGAKSASERETQIIQRIIEHYVPICMIDFHTADYVMMPGHQGDKELLDTIHQEIKDRLKDRYIAQKPYGGTYQQVNMNNISFGSGPQPLFSSYAASKGVKAAFTLEMSGNRDDVHAMVMNTDTVVEICLAAVKQCLAKLDKDS